MSNKMFCVKEIENGVLKHYIPELKAREIAIPENVHTVAPYCFTPETLDIDDSTDPDVFSTILEWDDLFELNTVIITKNVKKIERCAFFYIPNLERFVVEEGNAAFKVYDDVLLSADGTQLIACPERKYGDFIAPNGVKTIFEKAFASSRLSRVFLASSLTAIEEFAFDNALDLEEIYIPSSVTFIGTNAFGNCPALTIFAPKDSYAIQYAEENGISYKFLDEE